MSDGQIAILRADSIDADAVNRRIAFVWDQLRENSEFCREAGLMGIDAALLERASPPFVAERPEGQFGIAETLLIASATGAATEAGKIALSALWKEAIWPRLSRHFGAALEPSDDA